MAGRRAGPGGTPARRPDRAGRRATRPARPGRPARPRRRLSGRVRPQAVRAVRCGCAHRPGGLAGRRPAVPGRWWCHQPRRAGDPRRDLGDRAGPARGRHPEPARRGGAGRRVCGARRRRPGGTGRPRAGAAGSTALRHRRPAARRGAAHLRSGRAPGRDRFVRGRRLGIQRRGRATGGRAPHRRTGRLVLRSPAGPAAAHRGGGAYRSAGPAAHRAACQHRPGQHGGPGGPAARRAR